MKRSGPQPWVNAPRLTLMDWEPTFSVGFQGLEGPGSRARRAKASRNSLLEMRQQAIVQ